MCGIEKEYDDFYKAKGMSDGHKSECKQCSSNSANNWNKAHRERKNVSNRKWRNTHREYNARKAKEWRDEHYEQYRENINKWNENNRDKWLNYPKKRRAKILSAPINDLTQEQWEHIMAAYNYRCAYCGKKTMLTRDHIIPLSKGGSHTASNIVPACQSCNSTKRCNNAPIYQPILSVKLIEETAGVYDC